MKKLFFSNSKSLINDWHNKFLCVRKNFKVMRTPALFMRRHHARADQRSQPGLAANKRSGFLAEEIAALAGVRLSSKVCGAVIPGSGSLLKNSRQAGCTALKIKCGACLIFGARRDGFAGSESESRSGSRGGKARDGLGNSFLAKAS
ncbi:MAG TPA: hypothetical protein VFX02_09690 [Gammaproteobacteria bacterium]|nr:hypothetical protein [Gammaproteobacteria bacterium]